jgi:hypothetical protein
MQMTARADVIRSVRTSDGAGGFTQARDEVEAGLYCQIGRPRNLQELGGENPQAVQTIPVEIVHAIRLPEELDVLPNDVLEVTIGTALHTYQVIGTDSGTTDALTLTCDCERIIR